MARTYIDTGDRQSPFYQRMRRELASTGIDIVDSPLEATATFSVVSDITGQRVLSVSARNVPTEFEVYYTVAYAVLTETETLLDTRSQTRSRDYTWDETRVLGKEREEQLLRDALVDDIVRVVMIQLSGI